MNILTTNELKSLHDEDKAGNKNIKKYQDDLAQALNGSMGREMLAVIHGQQEPETEEPQRENDDDAFIRFYKKIKNCIFRKKCKK